MFCVQFSEDACKQRCDPWIKTYYDTLYDLPFWEDGWRRPKWFWEPPLWAAHVKANDPQARLLVLPSVPDRGLPSGQYAISVTRANEEAVRTLISRSPTSALFHLGGYIDVSQIRSSINVIWWPNLEEFVRVHYAKSYNPVPDHSIYTSLCAGVSIPRLTLSTGCAHRCAFCSVEKDVKTVPTTQVWDAFCSLMANLRPRLVYVNDKTFGQAPNYLELVNLGRWAHQHYGFFKGFIVQTTPNQARFLPWERLKNEGMVLYAELGVESPNDPILRAYRKPSSEWVIEASLTCLNDAGVFAIPNLMFGFPEETDATYQNTLKWMRANEGVIHHFNLTYYAKHDALHDNDANENTSQKSWHSDPHWAANWAATLTGEAKRQLEKRRMNHALAY